MTERAGQRNEPAFPTRTGRRLSTDAVERLVREHATTAAANLRTTAQGGYLCLATSGYFNLAIDSRRSIRGGELIWISAAVVDR
ncbi:hypothetical protein [Mycobacterium aquaticum]|uniref:hypothetical protein n=1 Tax=Mycobacterium aquaticum TaxID=1927124 RepID=UPI001FEA66A0|nr:hypothetical protein [Mycobacterium aquaticum]